MISPLRRRLCPVLTIMLLLWQALIYPQQYALIMTPTLTKSWIPTNSATMLIKAPPQPGPRTWMETLRFLLLF